MNFIKTSALTALFASTLAFANEPAPAAPAAPAAPEVAPAAPAKKVAHVSKKAALKQAKEECLAGDAGLKGKALHACVKGKLHK